MIANVSHPYSPPFLLPPLPSVVCSLSLFSSLPPIPPSLSEFGSMPGQEEALLCPLAQGAWEKPSYLSITVDFPIAACVFCSYAVTFRTAKAGSHHRLAPATTPASLFCFYTLSWTLFSQRLFWILRLGLDPTLGICQTTRVTPTLPPFLISVPSITPPHHPAGMFLLLWSLPHCHGSQHYNRIERWEKKKLRIILLCHPWWIKMKKEVVVGRGERETALFPRLKKNLFISTRKFSWRKQAFAAREFLFEQKHWHASSPLPPRRNKRGKKAREVIVISRGIRTLWCMPTLITGVHRPYLLSAAVSVARAVWWYAHAQLTAHLVNAAHIASSRLCSTNITPLLRTKVSAETKRTFRIQSSSWE